MTRKRASTRRRLRRLRLRGWLGTGRRDQERIAAEYSASWTRRAWAPSAMPPPAESGAAWRYAGETMFATASAGARARLLTLMRVVAWLRPRTVLEVGAGNGVNAFILACRFPDLRVTTVELTEGGVAVTRAALLEPFADCNNRGLRRAYRLARQYFGGRVADLPAYGLAPILVTDDLPGEIWLQPCLVTARKRPAGAPA